MTGFQLKWFSSFLKEEAAELSAPPVTVFVMGDNTWRDEDAWPPARSRVERFFLSTGSADGSVGGRLRHEPPAAEGGSTPYVFDPAQPVPTVGGATFLPGAYIGMHAGPPDHRAVDHRPDVLSSPSAVIPEAT